MGEQRSPRELTDDELARACLPPWAKALDVLGVVLALACFGALIVLVPGPPSCLRGSAAFVLASLVTLGIRKLATLPRRAVLAERDRRSGRAPIGVYVDDVRAESPALGWTVILRGSVLPHGGLRWIRLDVVPGDPPAASVEARSLSFEPGTAKLGALDRRRAELSAETASEIARWLLGLDEDALRSAPRWSVKDGFPCDIALVRREPFHVTVVECNLAGLPDGEGAEPLRKLADHVLSAAREAGTKPLLMGFYDDKRGIGIGPV